MTSVEIVDEFMGMSVCALGELTSVSGDYAMRRFHRVDGTGKMARRDGLSGLVLGEWGIWVRFDHDTLFVSAPCDAVDGHDRSSAALAR